MEKDYLDNSPLYKTAVQCDYKTYTEILLHSLEKLLQRTSTKTAQNPKEMCQTNAKCLLDNSVKLFTRFRCLPFDDSVRVSKLQKLLQISKGHYPE